MKKKAIGTLVAVILLAAITLAACGGGLTAPAPTLDGNTVKWEAVKGASKYIVSVNGKTTETEELSYTLTVTEPGNYVITVSASDGKETKTSAELTYTVKGTLSAPVITLSGNKVSWNAVPNATGYEVYVDGTLKATVTATNYSMPLNMEVGDYVVTVKAKGGDLYKDSASSNSVTFNVKPAEPVTQPLGKATIAIDGRTVTWNAVDNATAYDVYVNGVKNATVTATQYVFAGRTAGNYEITVKATAPGSSAYTEGEASNAVNYTVAALDLTKPVVAYIVGTKAMTDFDGNARIKQTATAWDELVADSDYAAYAWRLEANGEYYKIKVANGAYLTAIRGENRAFYAAAENTDNQLWSFETTDGGYFIRNKAYGGELLCAGDVGTDVIHFFSPADNVAAQTWSLFNVEVTFGQDIEILAAPVLELNGNVVTWTAVEHAMGYEVYVNGKLDDTVTEPTYTINATEEGYFAVTVKAVGGSDYLPSLMSNQVQYMHSTLDLTKPVIATYAYEEHDYVAEIGTDGYLAFKLRSDVAEADLYKYVWYLEKDGDLYKIKLYNGKYATWTGDKSGFLEVSANAAATGTSQQWHFAPDGLNEYRLFNKAHSVQWSSGSWTYYFSAGEEFSLKFTNGAPAKWKLTQSDIEFVEKTALAAPQASLTDKTVTWQAVDNAVSYNVFVNGELKLNVKANETLSYTIDDSVKGLYKVVIVAVADENGLYLDSEGSAEIRYDNRNLFDSPVVAYYNDANQTLGSLNEDGTLGVGAKYDTVTDYTDYLWTVEKITEGAGSGYYRIKLANGKYLSHYDNPNSGEVAQTIAAEDNVSDSKQWWNLVEDTSKENAYKLQNVYFSNYYQNVYLGEWYGVYKYNGACQSWTFFNWEAPVEA